MADFRQSSPLKPTAARIQNRYSLGAIVLVFWLAAVSAGQTVPSITSLSPSAGPVAASITINGSNFGDTQGTSAVTFNGTTATSITSWSASSITAIVPSAATSGNVVVTVGGSGSNGVNFTVIPNAFPGPISYAYDEMGRLIGATASTGDSARYNYDAVGNITSINRYSSSQLVLFSFAPKSGLVGTQVTIYGANFSLTAAQDTVSFNGTNASIVSASATQLVVTVPSGATSGPITVTAPLGSVASNSSFTVQTSSNAPTITSFTPSIAAVGAAISIAGTDFDPAPQNDRLFMNITAAYPSTSPPPTSTSMTATIPNATGSGHITLGTPGGIAVGSADLFIPPPSSGFTPSAVAFTGRTTLNSTTTVSLPNTTTLGLLLFDGIAGHSVSVSLSPQTASASNYQLYAPDGSALGSLTGCTAACYIRPQVLPVSGTYAVGITNATAAVTLYDATPVTASITPNGSSMNVNLPNPGQTARLTFVGTAGQQAAVRFTNINISTLVQVYLLNPDGTTLNYTSFASSTYPNGYTQGAVMLTQSGLHTILISPGFPITGSITASLSLQGGTRPLPARQAGSVLDPSSPLYANLVGLFVMNEGTGSTDLNLVDGQTAAFSGTGLPTWNTTDPSVAFAGGTSLNSYLNAGTDLNFDILPPSKMTVAAKLYLNTYADGGIAEKYYQGVGFGFYFDSNGSVHFQVGSMTVASYVQALATNRWIQVAVTWDGTVGSAANAHLFIDGVEQNKPTVSDFAGVPAYTAATNQPLYIGTDQMYHPSSFNGKMGYLAIYRGRMLSGTELSQLDSQVPVTPDLVGTITENGAPVTKTTTSSGQGVQLTFQAWYGQQVTVQLSNNTIGSVVVNLVEPNGTVLATTTSSAASFSVPTATLPMNGQYDVVVHPTGTTTGSITVALSVQGGFRPQGSVLDTSNPLSTNLAGLFIMNEATGTTDKNLVDNQTASFSGTSVPTWNTVDPSVVFNGGTSLNSYLNAGTDLTFDQLTPGKMTVLAKIYVNRPIAAAGVAEKNDGNSINSGFAFGWNSSGALRLVVERSTDDMIVAAANGAVQAGQWIQVAFTWDGTQPGAASAHLFINSVEQTKATSHDGSGVVGYAYATNQPFRIGNASIDTPMYGSLNGRMVYLAVYKGRILTTTEMNQLDAQLPIH